MKKKIAILKRFLEFYLAAQTKFDVHSPFVFRFITDVWEDHRWFYAFSDFEVLRRKLLFQKKMIQVTDYGAGSHVLPKKNRTVGDVARTSLTPAARSRFLFRLVEFWQPTTLLEFGTSLGVATLYQAAPVRNATFVTLEGCPNIATIAKQNFDLLKQKNITCLIGEFEQTLPKALQKLKKLDYVFFDGNHQCQPTLRYFEQCLPLAHEKTVFIFDDIYWSAGMSEAWELIKKHPRTRLTIDLFFLGLVFFRNETQQPEHFKLVPTKWKFWRIGFF